LKFSISSCGCLLFSFPVPRSLSPISTPPSSAWASFSRPPTSSTLCSRPSCTRPPPPAVTSKSLLSLVGRCLLFSFPHNSSGGNRKPRFPAERSYTSPRPQFPFCFLESSRTAPIVSCAKQETPSFLLRELLARLHPLTQGLDRLLQMHRRARANAATTTSKTGHAPIWFFPPLLVPAHTIDAPVRLPYSEFRVSH